MKITIEKIRKNRLVPVISIDNEESAVPLCQTLVEGGLPVAEITFRTRAAEKSIEKVAKALPQVLLGAGTILNVEQVKRAVNAGASFIVSPGFSHSVVRYCCENKIPVFPGAATPTEIQYLLEYGLTVAKFFPAEQAGGLPMIKALAAPYGEMEFLPTGGINQENILNYLSFPKVIACGGSWMVNSKLINEGRFDEILYLVKDAVKLVSK